MTKPNVILVLTDNQMAQTLACYGNSEVHTPHLDRMAAQGLRFDNAYCANAFCSPCRASVMTGMLPSQHGVHSWIDDRKSDTWPKGWNALAGLTTLPEKAKAQGYATGLFGKYHLGDPRTPAPGWDSWVTMADGHVRSFYDNRIYDNGDTYAQPGHSVDFFTDMAIDWIADQDGPYFAYVPLPAPYGHWPATQDGNRNRFAGLYDNCPMDSVPREGISAEAVANYDMIKADSGHGLDFSMLMRAPNHLPTLRNYYSQITMIDDAMGRIMQAAPDALILFAADHGLSLGHHGFWGHGAATYPSNLHRAAHSIPLIVQHKNHIAPAQVTDLHVSNTDLFATLEQVMGSPAERGLPSRSFAALFDNSTPKDWGMDAVFAEQEETRVIRTPKWLFFKRFDGAGAPALPDALYDLEADPGETTNLAAVPEYASVVVELSAQITAYFDQYHTPSVDMWRGGSPLQNTTIPRYWREVWGADWSPVFER